MKWYLKRTVFKDTEFNKIYIYIRILFLSERLSYHHVKICVFWQRVWFLHGPALILKYLTADKKEVLSHKSFTWTDTKSTLKVYNFHTNVIIRFKAVEVCLHWSMPAVGTHLDCTLKPPPCSFTNDPNRTPQARPPALLGIKPIPDSHSLPCPMCDCGSVIRYSYTAGLLL